MTVPVADVERSVAFFTRLGFTWNPALSDGQGACMLVGEQASVMLASHARFAELAKLPTGDPRAEVLSLYAFSVPSREDVDAVFAAALEGGGSEADGPEDFGFMYTRAFYDLDGHGWQVMWFDPDAGADGEG